MFAAQTRLNRHPRSGPWGRSPSTKHHHQQPPATTTASPDGRSLLENCRLCAEQARAVCVCGCVMPARPWPPRHSLSWEDRAARRRAAPSRLLAGRVQQCSSLPGRVHSTVWLRMGSVHGTIIHVYRMDRRPPCTIPARLRLRGRRPSCPKVASSNAARLYPALPGLRLVVGTVGTGRQCREGLPYCRKCAAFLPACTAGCPPGTAQLWSNDFSQNLA